MKIYKAMTTVLFQASKCMTVIQLVKDMDSKLWTNQSLYQKKYFNDLVSGTPESDSDKFAESVD